MSDPESAVKKPSEKVRVIRLKPSATDYATFVKATARDLGKEPDPRRTKPSERFLSLTSPESSEVLEKAGSPSETPA